MYLWDDVFKFNRDDYFDKDGQKKMYFVVETKGNVDSDALRPSEKAKIYCGKKHFNALSTGVELKAADDYGKFKVNVSLDDF